MNRLNALVIRNIKLYFKDKGMFFSSLITPIILLVLYGTFLRNVYYDSFTSALTAAGATVSDKLISGFVAGELVSSLLAVSCVTVAFCSNLIMVQDKITGARNDLMVAPLKKSTLAMSYYLATLFSTLLICFFAAAICFGYIAACGWYLSVDDVVAVIRDIVLLVLMGTAISSLVNYPLTTQGQASAVGTIVSAGYGFLCGAYMPISQFSKGIQKVMAFLPGTYGTSLLRNHTLRGTFAEMEAKDFPAQVIEAMKDSVDCNIYFFDKKVSLGAMNLVLFGTIVLALGIYIVINLISSRRRAAA
ncbi:MAG: ABC transporter permease [Clostridiales bacterium]|nr:ABC transporter permease [Clostridiales bacterium]